MAQSMTVTPKLLLPSGSYSLVPYAIGVLIVAVVCALAYLALVGASGPALGIKDAGTVIALAGICAVGIERVLEVFWTAVDELLHAWWPLNAIPNALTALTGQMNASFGPVFDQARKDIDAMQQSNKLTPEAAELGKQRLDTLQGTLQSLSASASRDGAAAEYAAQKAQTVLDTLQQAYPSVQQYAPLAQQGVADLTSFLATFPDNPARRLLSIYAGCLIGLGIAVVLRLDLFQSPSGTGTAALTTVLSGLVLGLGSNPTHEIIQAIQAFKAQQGKGGPA
jgi:hypothetical protein